MTTDRARIAQLEKRIGELEEIVTQLAADQGIDFTVDDPAAAINDQIIDILRQGRKIEAIKLYRETTGYDLAEAKDYVEDIEARIKRGEY